MEKITHDCDSCKWDDGEECASKAWIIAANAGLKTEDHNGCIFYEFKCWN